MKHSPIQLLRYVVPELSCSANPVFDSGKPYVGGMENFSVQATVTRLEAPKDFQGHSWSVVLTISQQVIEGQNFPYTFKVSMVGFFACKGGIPSEPGEERFIRVNGSSVLFGAARELVRSMTARGPWGEVIIPTLSFYDNEAPQKEPNIATLKTE